MQADVTFDETGGFFVIRVSGQADMSAMVQVIRRIVDSEHYPVMSGAVWDFRDADLSAMTLDVMRRLWVGQTESAVRTDLRVASVFAHPQDGVILNLWQTAADGYNRMLRRSFTDMAAARRWVGGDDPAA